MITLLLGTSEQTRGKIEKGHLKLTSAEPVVGKFIQGMVKFKSLNQQRKRNQKLHTLVN